MAVSGAIFRLCRYKLYQKLGLESIQNRIFLRELCVIFADIYNRSHQIFTLKIAFRKYIKSYNITWLKIRCNFLRIFPSLVSAWNKVSQFSNYWLTLFHEATFNLNKTSRSKHLEVFCKKRCSYIFRKNSRENTCDTCLFLNKVASLT